MSFKYNRKRIEITTYSKVISLLTMISVGFVVLFSILFYYINKQEKQTIEVSKAQFSREVNSLLDLNAQGYINLINEITYWDELVNFIENKDVRWFNASIAYLVDTNRVDYIDGYTIDGDFVTKVATSKIHSSNFIPKEVFPILMEKKFVHFYAKIPEGIVEIYGSTVHPSEDPFKNKTKPRGFLFFAKLLDAKYFANLEGISGSEIHYSNQIKNYKNGKTYFHYDLKNFRGSKIQTIVFIRNFKIDFSTAKYVIYIIAIAALVSLFILVYYARKWARRPIKLIRSVLEDGNQDAIGALKLIPGEFRHIGKLFEENNNQKKALEIAKNKAEESDKLKTAFLTNLSHEIRTPMNAILGFSELINNTNISELDKDNYIRNIQKSGKNLMHIIEDLLEMSRIDSKLIKAKITSFDLKKLVNDTIQIQTIQTLNKPNLELKVIHPVGKYSNILTDEIKLTEVISNLISNAIRFTNEGFVILEYKYNLLNKKIIFQVKDSGIGISKNDLELIFKRFSKGVENHIATNASGLGLGLAISNGYVDLLGGEINVQSEQGVGSTFTFSIDLEFDTTIKSNIELVEQPKKLDLGNEKIILIAEDDNLNFLLLAKIIKELHFKVLRAYNGQEAIDLVRSNEEIDLVFMDIKMPVLDGHSAFEEIRKFNSEIPIVAQTAFSFEEEINRIVSSGFNGYITKPIDRNKVNKILSKFF